MAENMDDSFPDIPGYRVLALIGGGGMATIYLAEQEKFEREVALKIMEPRLLNDPVFGQRFLREARIVAQLVHPNFLPVFDLGQSGDNHYIAMEYLPGGDLREALHRGISLPQGLRVIRDVARGLNYAAEKNFVHRDIKPGNILLRADNSAVICDFGIARDADVDSRMTETGILIGTPKYMSPEQIQGRELDGRSDLYGLGVIAFEMLTGRLPFNGDSSIAISYMHVNNPIPELEGELSVLQPFIDKALAKEPDDRFQSGEEMVQALAELEAEHYELLHAQPDTIQMSEDAIQSAVSYSGRLASKKRRRWLAKDGVFSPAGLGLIVMLGLLLGALWWLVGSPAREQKTAVVAPNASIEKLNRQLAQLEWKAGAAEAQEHIRDRDYLAARSSIDALEDSGADSSLVEDLRASLNREQERELLETQARQRDQAESEQLESERVRRQQIAAQQAERDRLAQDEQERLRRAQVKQQQAVAARQRQVAMERKADQLQSTVQDAIDRRDFVAARSQLEALGQLVPNSGAVVDLQDVLQTADANHEQALLLLQQADELTAAAYPVAAGTNSNRRARQGLQDAVAKIESARKVDNKCTALPRSISRLGAQYTAIINANIEAGELAVARRLLDDFDDTGLFPTRYAELDKQWIERQENAGRGKINIPSF